MYLQNLKNILVSQGLNRASAARLAGVSRACVTRWFQKNSPEGWVNVETKTLQCLADSLGINAAFFLQKTPNLSYLATRFLWDRLYPTMEHFVQAVSQGRLLALARLVQILGFMQARRIAGNTVISRFHHYKKYVIPVRRQQLELLWPLYHSQQ